MPHRSVVRLLAGILLLATLAAPVAAQDLWPEPRREPTVDLEYVRPIPESTDLGGLSGLWRFSAALPLDPKSRVVVVVPFTVAELESDFSQGNSSAIGNVYVGAEIGAPGSALTGQLGAYLPTTPDAAGDAALLGFYGDFDRLEAYLPNSLALRGALQYRMTDPGGFLYGFRVGGSGIAPSGGGGGTGELVLDYGLIFGIEQSRVRIAATVDGRLIATAGAGVTLQDRTVHQAGAEVVLLGWRVEPRLTLRVPMDEALEGVGPSVGLGATVRLGG